MPKKAQNVFTTAQKALYGVLSSEHFDNATDDFVQLINSYR